MLHLDRGILEHYAGKYAESARDLEEAERLIQEAYTRSLGEDIAAYFGNDNARSYAGEDYEDIYTNVFNALNFYHQGDLGAAGVEVRQISEKLAFLEDKYGPARNSKIKPELVSAFVANALGTACAVAGLEGFLVDIPGEILKPDPPALPFKDSALARYLSAVFYRGGGKADDARIDLHAVSAIHRASPHIYRHAADVAGEYSVPPGKARLNFIAFSGLSPVKAEKIEDLDLKFFPTISALRTFDNEKLRLTWGNLALPVLEERPSTVTSVSVSVNGENLELGLLEDFGAVIRETFNVKYPSIRARAYIRALIKYMSVEIAAQTAIEKGLSEMLIIPSTAALKKSVDIAERADIRSSRYFPGKAFAGGINLEPGLYSVTFTFSGGEKTSKEMIVEPGRVNLIEAFCLK